MPTFHITVRGADREAMADLVRVHGVRVLPQALDESGAESRVDALADESTIQRLTDAGYRVEQHEDVDEAAREDLQQMGRATGSPPTWPQRCGQRGNGRGPQRASIPKSFHPDYSDMVTIIEEVTAALLAFCSAVASRGADLQDTGQAAAIPG